METVISTAPEKTTVTAEMKATVKMAAETAAEFLAVPDGAEVSIVLTGDGEVRELNREYRDIDRSTDVLSFALDEGEETQLPGGPDEHLLGDIVISVETAARQATEYGHSLERELAFLTVHGMLHLLGYDHMNDKDRLRMRTAEEQILAKLGLVRE